MKEQYKIHLNFLGSCNYSKKERIIIYSSNPHIQSQAQLVLLKNYYKSLSKTRDINESTRIKLTFRNRFLRKLKKKNKGKLTCRYCSKTNLKHNNNGHYSKGLEATLEHVIPTSKGGSKFLESNLDVSCLECNSRKGDKIWD